MNISAFAAAYLSDRLFKAYARNYLDEGAAVSAVPGSVYFKRVRNYGFARNILSGRAELVKNVSAAALLLSILYAIFFMKDENKAVKAGFSLMLGGGASNLRDRLRDGYVTDFICFGDIGDKRKAARKTVFNPADLFIFAGMAVCAVFSLFGRE